MTLDSRIRDLASDIASVVKSKAALAHSHIAANITDFAAAVDARIGAATDLVRTSGSQSIGGVKTFTSAPIVPNGSFGIEKTNGLQEALAAKQDIPATPLALFFGSSNATAGTWPEKFATKMGWATAQYKIFSIGGGAFTGVGAGSFDGQLTTAIADSTIVKANVTHIFLGDVSNDIRALSNITATATSWFMKVKANYPNAEIVVLPVVWGNSANNNTSNSLNSLGVRVQELRNVIKGLEYEVKVVEGSWRWLADDPNWMNADGSVHPNSTGYTRIANFMVDAMKGRDVSYDVGSKFIAPLGSINAGASYWTSARSGDFGNISGNLTVDSAQGVDSNLGQLPYGVRPKAGFFLPVVNASRAVAGTLLISETGLIRSFSTLPAGTYNFNTTYKCF